MTTDTVFLQVEEETVFLADEGGKDAVFLAGESKETFLQAGDIGLPGPVGPSGITSIIPLVGEAIIPAFSAIYIDAAGLARIADKDNPAKVEVIGVNETLEVSGAPIEVFVNGELFNAVWTWTPGLPIFLSTGGLLTQTAPTTGHVVAVGIAKDIQTILIRPARPIELAP